METNFQVGDHIQGYSIGYKNDYIHGIVHSIEDKAYVLDTGYKINKDYATTFDQQYWFKLADEKIRMALANGLKSFDFMELDLDQLMKVYKAVFGDEQLSLVNSFVKQSINL